MSTRLQRPACAVAGALVLALVEACGGGGSGAQIVPVTLTITTTTMPDGVLGTAYNSTVAVNGGSGALTFSISAGSLPAGLALNASSGAVTGTPTATGTSNFTMQVVDSGTPQRSDTQTLSIDITDPLVITTAALPGTAVGAAYNQTVVATGGTAPLTFSISNGSLPAGLSMSAAGVITGSATAAATSRTFTVRVADSSSPQLTDTQSLSIDVIAVAVTRNDTIADATPLGNGTFAVSISPSGDPNTTLAPDEDYYEITTTAASTVTIDINAQINGSPLDSVIEIVNASGVQLSACVAPTFTTVCEHDDEDLGVDLDSFLQIQVGGATTFYVHVVDFRGDARPDLLYEIVISGVN